MYLDCNCTIVYEDESLNQIPTVLQVCTYYFIVGQSVLARETVGVLNLINIVYTV